MYGYGEKFADLGVIIRNEIAMHNLITIASNEALFNTLERKTQQDLMTIIDIYTNESIKTIKSGNSELFDDEIQFDGPSIKL